MLRTAAAAVIHCIPARSTWRESLPWVEEPVVTPALIEVLETGATWTDLRPNTDRSPG